MKLGRRQVTVGAALGSFGAACKMEAPSPGSATLGSEASSGRPSPKDARERGVLRVVGAERIRDGAGVAISRALGTAALPMIDPFLLLGEIRSDDPNDYAAGFPAHPHRGFETVTYVLDGAMSHADSVGNRGLLGPGSAQWMTAGRGIVHSEMPRQERGSMWSYQLWVNLPRARKMIRPRYQDVAPERIPLVEHERARIRVIAGSIEGVTGPVSGIDVEPTFLDLALSRGASLSVPLAASHNAFVFVIEGAVRLGPSRSEVRRGQVALLTPGERLPAACDADSGRMLLFAGRPLNEPVARRGPFVMSTDEELRQAFEDYRTGRLTEG